MKYTLLTLSLFGALATSGCISTQELEKYVTVKTYQKGVQVSENGDPMSPGNEPVVNAEVQPADSTSYSQVIAIDNPITYAAHTLDATYKVNIDTAARAIKREFNFKSPKDLRRLYGNRADAEMVTSYWRYEADAGHYYQMRYYVTFGNSRNVIDIEMFPTKNGTRFMTTYWVESGNSAERQNVKNTIRAKINSAVLPYS